MWPPVAGRHAGSSPEYNGPLSCLPRPGRPQPQPGQLCHQPDCVPKCGGGFCHPSLSLESPFCQQRNLGCHGNVHAHRGGRAGTFVWRPAASPATLAWGTAATCQAVWAWRAVWGGPCRPAGPGPSPPPPRPHTSLRAGTVPGARPHPSASAQAGAGAATAESRHHHPVRDGRPSPGPEAGHQQSSGAPEGPRRPAADG